MKIGILTCSTKNRKWLYDITNTTKEKYCSAFGYEYIFDDAFYPDKTRHPYWNKIKFVAKFLPEFDYVIWMDDDAGFVRYDLPIDNFLRCNFGYCEDLNGFNCGVFSVKRSFQNAAIFEYIWSHMYPSFKNHVFPEQDALKEIYQIRTPNLGTQFDGSIYNAYDPVVIKSKNQRTAETLILHIAGGSEYKERNKQLIKNLFSGGNG